MRSLGPVLLLAAALLAASPFAAPPASAEPAGGLRRSRIKDIARIKGVRENPLVGQGLVFGLQGTGDGNNFVTSVLFQNLLRELHGITIEQEVKPKNVAAVEVTAVLPPYSTEGDRVDVIVSTLGDASSLAGGILVLTPLKGADGNIYAVAQGAITNAGVGQVRTVGRVPGAAIIEREPPSPNLLQNDQLVISLRRADFFTASTVAQAVNRDRERLLGLDLGAAMDRIAYPRDARNIVVQVPAPYHEPERLTDFIARIEQLAVDVVDTEAAVVIDPRTRAIAIGGEVLVSPVIVSLPGIQIMTRAPDALPDDPGTPSNMARLPISRETRLENLLDDLRQLQVGPEDLIAVIQAIDRLGKLHGRVIVE